MKKLTLLFCLFVATIAQAQTKEETLEWLKLYGTNLLSQNFKLPEKFDYDSHEKEGVYRGSFKGFDASWAQTSMAITFYYQYDNSLVVPKTKDSNDYVRAEIQFSDIYLPEENFVIEEASSIPHYYRIGYAEKTLKPLSVFYKLTIKVKNLKWYKTDHGDYNSTETNFEIICTNKENLRRVGNAILNMAKFNGAKKRVNANTY